MFLEDLNITSDKLHGFICFCKECLVRGTLSIRSPTGHELNLAALYKRVGRLCQNKNIMLLTVLIF